MMKKILVTLLFCFSFVYANLIETTTVKNAQGVGVGLSRSDAVNNAIIEALGQINGLKINKTTFVDSATVNSTNGNSAAYVYSSQISKVTQGKVDSYSIVDVSDLGDGKYEATVEITKTQVSKEYKTPGLNPKKRRSLAVVPAYSSRDYFDVLGVRKSAQDVSQRYTQEFVSSLTKTRKFTVLDREANQAYADEKALLLSRDAHPDELFKLGNVMGADYLVISNITEFRVYHEIETIQITGQSKDYLKAYATIQYRVLAMATRQIKWSNTTTFEFEPKGQTFEQVYLEVLKKISDDLTYEMIENIYPIKVADISSSGQVILSQSAEIGTRYEVYGLGKKLYDPYTKEFLGQDEELKGEIEVVRTLPKVAYANITNGSASAGDICRKIGKNNQLQSPKPEITEADKPSEVEQKESGGVKLPFD